MYDKRSRLSSEVWEELYKYFPGRIFRTIIPRNISLAEAPSFGKSILEYDPSSTGGKAYQRLAKEFLYHFYAR
jgi:chromosome partitioning protein